MSETQTISTDSEVANVEAVSQEQSPVETQETQAKPESEVAQKEPEKTEPEVKADEKKEQEKKDRDRFAAKFAALSRKEKALKQQEQEFLSLKKQVEEQTAKLKEIERLKRENPLKYLQENGLTYEDLTLALLNNGELTPEQKQQNVIAALQDEINALKTQLKETVEQQAEREAKEAEMKMAATVKNFKNEIKTLVSSSEKYELTAANEMYETVYEVIDQHYQETGEILDIETAADLVERHLEDEAEKLLKTKKLASKFTPPPSTEERKTEKAHSEAPKTLENELSSQVPNRQVEKLDEDELLRKAAGMIRWE